MSNDPVAKIAKRFETFRYSHDLYTVFSHWCELAALSLSNAVDRRQYEKREARYLEIVGRYKPDEVKLFPTILADVTMALEENPTDLLGAVFHALELHNTDRGQFFTPFEICRLMASINLAPMESLKSRIEAKGFIEAHEPAVGAGAMIIALALEMQRAGINYQQHLHVSAIDIDPRAVHMAYVQFSLMHIPASILVGDTLRMEFSEEWFTPAHVLGGWGFKLRASERERKDQAPEPVATIPVAAPARSPTPKEPVGAGGQLNLF